MPIVHLVRHARAASITPDPRDPELSDDGREQALQTAHLLRTKIGGPIAILTSPLRRCRQTAEPLSRLWGAAIRLEPRVAEVPSPQLDGIDRSAWLGRAFESTWSDLERAERARDASLGTQLAH